jgi:fructose-1-phosphate kinase PfkB-like protein
MVAIHALLLTSWVMGGSTVIVGLNAALQKRFILPPTTTLVPGDVHRATEVQTGVGGKGQDVAIALSCLNFKNLQLAQFIGSGAEGNQVFDLLQDLLGADAMSLTVRPASHMRTCTTIVASNASTELVEPSDIITSDEQDELMTKLSSSSDSNASPGALCIMGSMPPGCPPEMYADIYERIHGADTLCLIDSVVGLEPLLKTIANSKTRGPAILKVNASELCRLAKVKKTSSEVGGIDSDELVEGIKGFLYEFQPYASEALSGFAITDGKHPAHCITLGEDGVFEIFRIPAPDLSGVDTLYPIGAGDTVAATTLAAWRYLRDVRRGGDCTSSLGKEVDRVLKQRADAMSTDNLSETTRIVSTALAFGISCGSASCLKEENSQFDVADSLRLLDDTSQAAFVSRHALTK